MQSSRRKFLDQACEAVRTFKPLSADERTALAARVQDAALHGRFERYKTTSVFDSTAKHPAWLGDSAS